MGKKGKGLDISELLSLSFRLSLILLLVFTIFIPASQAAVTGPTSVKIVGSPTSTQPPVSTGPNEEAEAYSKNFNLPLAGNKSGRMEDPKKEAKQPAQTEEDLKNSVDETDNQVEPNDDADNPELAQEWYLRRLQDEKGQIPANGVQRALLKAKNLSGSTSPTRNGAGIAQPLWSSLGPSNADIGGRVRSLVFDKTNSNMYAGAVSGGVWHSSNFGASWNPVGDTLGNLSIGALLIDPNNHQKIFAGTGEGFATADVSPGTGVYYTTDSGSNWTQLASTTLTPTDWLNVNVLAMTGDSAVLLAGTNTALMRSTDTGVSWQKVITGRIYSLQIDPSNDSKMLASSSDGQVFFSTDKGASWSVATIGWPVPTGRVSLTFAQGMAGIVYASVNVNGGEVWRSTDGGQTFTQINTGLKYLGSQGNYGNTIWVDPTSTNPATALIIVGGVYAWRSTDGGQNWTQISYNAVRNPTMDSLHPDIHSVVPQPGYNGTSLTSVFFASDGGIWRTDNISTVITNSGWIPANNELRISQFYNVAGNNSNGYLIGGTQDNGTQFYTTTSTFKELWGGDGADVAADQTNQNFYYSEYPNLQVMRNSTGGSSPSYGIFQGITDQTITNSNFISPIALDPNNPAVLFSGGASLWRTTNANATDPTQIVWSAIKAPLSSNCFQSNTCISAIAVAPGNSNLVWVGHNNGKIYYSQNATSSNPVWNEYDAGLPGRVITRIVFDPTNPNTVYVTFGGFTSPNIYKLTSIGGSWTPAAGSGSGALPSAPVYAFAVNPNNSNWLYAGTHIGLFTSEDGGTTWSNSQDGPIRVQVFDLKFVGSATLIAATYGRGLWKTSVSTSLGGGNPANCTEDNLKAALANGGYIKFDCGPNPITITLTSRLSITPGSNTVLDGGSPDLVTLSGGGQYGVLFVPQSILTLENITLANGKAAQGGAIENSTGTVTLNNVRLVNNQAANGGAIYNEELHYISADGKTDYYNCGPVTLNNSKVYSNTAIYNSTTYSDGYGGGISNLTGCTLTINSSDIYSNTAIQGAGVYNIGGGVSHTGPGTVKVTGSSFYSNTLSSGYSPDPYYGVGIYIGSLSSISLDQSKIYNNSAGTKYGAGLYSAGDVNVTNSNIYGNNGRGLWIDTGYTNGITSISDSRIYSNTGDGIFNTSNSLTVTNTQLYSNTISAITANGSKSFSITSSKIYGNNIGIKSTTETHIQNVEVYNNTGNGLNLLVHAYYQDYPMTVTQSSIHDNQDTGVYISSNDSGGGTHNYQVTLDQVSIYHNTGKNYGNAGGLVNSGAPLTVSRSSIFNNASGLYSSGGGGITSFGNSYGPAVFTLTNSTVYSNSTNASSTNNQGGGILLGGPTVIANTTIAGNQANEGGGIYVNTSQTLYSPLQISLINVTLANNSALNGNPGANLKIASSPTKGTLTATNTIIAAPAMGSNCDLGGRQIDGGYNLEYGQGSPSATCGFTVSAQTGDPYLAPLAPQGGNGLPVMALYAGSAALDKANLSICSASPVNSQDQRELSRPVGSGCDIGAFEGTVPGGPLSVIQVTKGLDDGSPGTFSYILANAGAGATITFPAGLFTVTFSSGHAALPPVPAGVTIQGSCGSGGVPNVTIDATNLPGSLQLGGSDKLTGLKLSNFAGPVIKASGGSGANTFRCVVAKG